MVRQRCRAFRYFPTRPERHGRGPNAGSEQYHHTDHLAAIDPGPPYVSNGIALRLSDLASPTNAADEIGGSSYAEFYGSIAASVGRHPPTLRTN